MFIVQVTSERAGFWLVAGGCNRDCAWISGRSAASFSLPNRIISLWITENVNNLWQYNDYTKFPSNFFNSKSISNYLALPLAKVYLIWGALNNGSEKFFYDRFVAKLSNHKSNFLRHNLCSFQFSKSLENFLWGRIGFFEMQVKLLLWKCRCLPITGQPQSRGRSECGERPPSHLPFSFFSSFSFPSFQGLEMVLTRGLKVPQYAISFVNLSWKTRQNSSFAFKKQRKQ